MAPLPGIRQQSFGNCVINLYMRFGRSTIRQRGGKDIRYSRVFPWVDGWLIDPWVLGRHSQGQSSV